MYDGVAAFAIVTPNISGNCGRRRPSNSLPLPMPEKDKHVDWLLGLGGAACGVVAGYLGFLLLTRLGFYGLVLPGALLGIGCGALSRGKSNQLGIACGVFGVLAGIVTEWRFAPFIKDASFAYFITHLQDLGSVTLVSIAGGGVFAFWFGRGREGGVRPLQVKKSEVPVARNMTEMRATANEHIRRDMEAGRKWICQCQDCHEIRSLIGVEKTLDVRPLVRRILRLEEQLEAMPDGLERGVVLDEYLKAYDELAEVMSR
jgi:hypothetical protein